ncbi:SNF2-related protein [uncultured Oscillibacter sp.]|uniref:SNF2-related protein n=1 Tax=uncultured Oscillibacter sp. TaxID=876091 RepID=UPI00272AF1F3|nr:SNF2-related protein [uncultured Oscillibacter sp.]
MKYEYHPGPSDAESRRMLNEKVLYLIDSGTAAQAGITSEDIYNAYTGDGGLHGLERKDFDNYHSYSEAKKEIENGQFFTPPSLCQLVAEVLKPSQFDLVADLTCGKGSFFNFFPIESNLYGCEIDAKACKVARYLFPAANIISGDIRTYKPEVRFDYVVGNPPFNLRWWAGEDSEILSQLYYCYKAAELLKPLGILALIVPRSFLSDDFSDKAMIREMERRFSFLGQVGLPDDAFAYLGVESFPTKLQLWQKKSEAKDWKARRYILEFTKTLSHGFDPVREAQHIYEQMLMLPKADLEKNKSHVLLELAKEHSASKEFAYQTQKMLYQIKVHPAINERYAKCCEYLHRFYTQKMPEDMDYKEWQRVRITEAKVLSYLRRVLHKQNRKPERDVIALVKQDDNFVYKAYSAKTRSTLTDNMKMPVPVYQAVLDNALEQFPGFERLLRRKRREYDNQSQPFADMAEDPAIGAWLEEFTLWDAENEEDIYLNDIQRRDINRMLQKRYGMLQWEQGSGKTLAAIAMGLYRMQNQGIHSTWVVSSAISIRNNWDVVLPNYGLSYVFVERLGDLTRIKPGDFVLVTLNKLGILQRHIKKWIRRHNQNVMLVLDESDEISNPYSKRAKSTLSCFRRCRMKLLTTGTSTRNNISEFAPQLELLYNNSINMITWCSEIYSYDKENEYMDSDSNDYYGRPIPAYKRGYSLFSSCHLPEKPTVFGIGERTQDIYNANELNDILGKTVITRTFEEVTGKEIRRIHQVPLAFTPEEEAVYNIVMKEFHKVQREYFASTGNSRKDAMLRLMQQITLMLRVAAAPNTLKEYYGDTPLKIMTAVEMAAQWEQEIVAIGVRHQNVLNAYAEAFREYLPDRPLFTVTGSTRTFAQRRALRKTLRDSGNGILLCTQQSLPSSVNFEYVNKILIPEMHFNNSGMSQFYMRFIRFTSKEYKDIYFLNYTGSLESNLLQMVMAKEKINLFMKGQDTDLDQIYEKFGVDYNLLALLMRREVDEEGKFQIRWGDQQIA